MRIQTKLASLVVLFAAGLVVFGGVAFWVMNQVKVDGPYYKSIVQGKDIIADILPPPEYLVESYLNAFQISVERDRSRLEALVAKSEALRSDYELRHEYWIRELADGPMKEALVVDSYLPGLGFLDAKDRIFIPAALSGDSALMRRTLHAELTPKYEEHLSAAQVESVSDSSGRISESVGTVASETEKMKESIGEITRRTAESARVAGSAVVMAQSTQTVVNKLGASSSEIGGIVKTISSIAFQSNLLALNAAIEAARAGDAGKGFAVVADEVRNLAIETAKATEEIGRKIEAIRCDTEGVINAIGDIIGTIVQISEMQVGIASAVEKQTRTTRDISRNISSAARGTSEITGNIEGVSKAAQSTASGAVDTQKAAGELVRMAEELSRFVT